MVMKIGIIKKSNAVAASRTGFSLAEMIVVVAILGILSAIAIPSFFFILQRERIQSVALEVAGWLEQVRNAAADEVSASGTGGGCEVTFGSSGILAANGQLATVNTDCSVPTPILNVSDGVQQNTISVIVSGDNPIIFTPRGMWINTAGVPGTSFQISMTLSGFGSPLRCVRLSPVLGAVEIGRPQNNSATCTNWMSL